MDRLFSRQYLREHRYLLLSILVLVLYLLLYVVQGKDSHIFIDDNLDDNFIKYKVLADNGALFANPETEIPNYLGGFPKKLFVQLLPVVQLLFFVLPPLGALFVNAVLMHALAFVGMYLLLRRHILSEAEELVVCGVATCFALLPFWPPGGLSVAGFPLALNTFLNFQKREARLFDWIVLAFVPLYSLFAQYFVFFIFCIAVFWVYTTIRERKINWLFLLSIVFFTAVFAVVNIGLIRLTFFSDFVSIREEMKPDYIGFAQAVLRTGKNFLLGQWHVQSLQTVIILPLTVFVLVHSLITRNLQKEFLLVLVLTIIFSLIYGFNKWHVVSIIENRIAFMKKFAWSRFYYLNMLTWSALFALGLMYLNRTFTKHGGTIVAVLISLQVVYCFANRHEVMGAIKGEPTYREFFAEELFRKIDEHIGEDKTSFRVGSIGLHPAIAIYNGFYTVDGYHAYASLEYKHKFRKIIERELEKSPHYRQFFDDWGSRIYLLNSELESYSVKKGSGKSIDNLELNIDAFKALGGVYIFSAVPIRNYEQNGLTYIESFADDHSAWDVYLYQVRDQS